MMSVGVDLATGGRDFGDTYLIDAGMKIAMRGREKDAAVIVGSKRGADGLVYWWCRRNGIPCSVLDAYWDEYGVKAGPIRNGWMLRYGVTRVIAFPGGNGTADMVRQANQNAIPVYEYQWRDIFVFGSNLAGIHGAGSALEAAKNHGAKAGVGVGLYGESYAIPTKDANLKTLPRDQIAKYIDDFLVFARDNTLMRFSVVKIGCGLAGYSEDDIAPLFEGAPNNVLLPYGWRRKWGR